MERHWEAQEWEMEKVERRRNRSSDAPPSMEIFFFRSLLINIAEVDDIGVIDSVFGGGLVGCGARRSRPR